MVTFDTSLADEALQGDRLAGGMIDMGRGVFTGDVGGQYVTPGNVNGQPMTAAQGLRALGDGPTRGGNASTTTVGNHRTNVPPTTVARPVAAILAPDVTPLEAIAANRTFFQEQASYERQEQLARKPANTLKNYKQAQQHYFAFIARSSQFQTEGRPEHVNEGRVYSWVKFALTEPKKNLKAGSYNSPPADSDELPTLKSDGSPASRQPSTVRNWISGIVALWVEQKEKGMNSEGHPAPPKHATMRAIEAYEAKYAAVLAKGSGDRGRGRRSELFGLSHQQQLCRKAIFDYGRLLHKESTLMERAFFTMQFSNALRVNVSLNTQLAHIGAFELNTEEGQPGWLVGFDVRNDKRQLHTELRQQASMRAVDYRICPHGALAFWLFFRFAVSREQFPDLTDRDSWIQRPLLYLPGRKSPKKQISRIDELSARIEAGVDYRDALSIVKQNFKMLGINLKKKTHAFRGGAARNTEECGVSEAQIERLGSWTGGRSALRSSYLSDFPMDAIRAQAGHKQELGLYFVDRAVVEPDEALLAQVFPKLNGWTQQADGGWPRDKLQYLEDTDTQDFIRLLAYLRIVLLQDMALVRQEDPQHWLLQYHPLCTDEFRAFADKVASHCGEASTRVSSGASAALAQISPDITQALNTQRRTLSGKIKDVATRVDNVEATVIDSGTSVQEAVELGFKEQNLNHQTLQSFVLHLIGQTNLKESVQAGVGRLEALLMTAVRQGSDPQALQATHASAQKELANIMQAIFAQETTSAPLQQCPPPALAQPTRSSQGRIPASSTSSTATIAPLLAPGTCPPYEMSKSTKSVIELAEEWWVPHGAYRTCIARLEETYGPRWREDLPDPKTGKRKNAKSKYFGDRMLIIGEVERRAEAKAKSQNREVNQADRMSAARELDDERQGISIYALQEKLRGQRPSKRRRTAAADQQTPSTG